jgi:hypothetical protein
MCAATATETHTQPLSYTNYRPLQAFSLRYGREKGDTEWSQVVDWKGGIRPKEEAVKGEGEEVHILPL